MEIPFLADLWTRINAKKQLKGFFSEKETLRILAKTAKGLAYMHSLGIAHWDIKPDNVFFSEDNILKVGNPLLSTTSFDASSNPNVLKTCAIGTPAYLAPEVLLATSNKSKLGEFDAIKADCWSFGVFIFEILSFTLPFKFKSFSEFTENVPKKDLKIPEITVNPKISAPTVKMLKEIYQGLLN